MSLLKRALLFSSALLLWACDTPRFNDPLSQYYDFPQGGRFVLNQRLEIPPGRASVRIQYGTIVPFGSVQEQDPHCVFEIDSVRETPQYIEPDSFGIAHVSQTMTPLGMATNSGFSLIHPAFAADFQTYDSSRPTQMFYRTTFKLHSRHQPGVRSMLCQSDQYAAGVTIPRFLTVAEIRQALGGVFTLELN